MPKSDGLKRSIGHAVTAVLLVLTLCSNASAAATRQDKTDKEKLQELSDLCDKTERDLEFSEAQLDRYKKRVKNLEKEVTELRAADKEDQTGDAEGKKALAAKQAELDEALTQIGILKQKVTELTDELERVRKQRDALRGPRWTERVVIFAAGVILTLLATRNN